MFSRPFKKHRLVPLATHIQIYKKHDVCRHRGHSKGRDNSLTHMKENDQKKKKAKEKGTWVQLKGQPALPREAHL
ncbi:large ribosomal subunit protein eL21-like [Ctenodactylus gundi]